MLFCVRDADPAALAHLSEGLATQVNDDGVIPGPVANTDVDLIGVVADRYSGFQLAGVDAAGQESSEHPEVSGWLSAMRTNHDWPNVVSAENTYLSAENEADAHTVMEREPVLTGVLSSTAELGFRAVDVAARITADQLVPARGVEDV